MGMTVRRLPALGSQPEGGGSGPSPQMQEKVRGPACRMLPPAKQDAACGVMVTTESVKCGLTWNVKLQVNRKEGVGFEGLRASQLHICSTTNTTKQDNSITGGGFKIALAVRFRCLAQMPCLVHGSGVFEPRAFRDRILFLNTIKYGNTFFYHIGGVIWVLDQEDFAY